MCIIWLGRYGRIPGDSSVFHIKNYNNWWPVIIWCLNDEKAQCPACNRVSVEDLVNRVNRAKQRMVPSNQGGGEFLINEFGQILVPSPFGDHIRMKAGELNGKILFENSFNNGIIDLWDDHGLVCGDSWPLPYIGCQYNLSQNHNIYYWHSEKKYKELCPIQDQELIDRLRCIRRYGPVRFVVNPGGLVLTKRPPLDRPWMMEERWDPVYVGRINYQKWFLKE